MSKKDSTKAELGHDSTNGRQQRITELTTRLNEVFKQASHLGEKEPTKKSMLVRVDDLSNRVEFWQSYAPKLTLAMNLFDKSYSLGMKKF